MEILTPLEQRERDSHLRRMWEERRDDWIRQGARGRNGFSGASCIAQESIDAANAHIARLNDALAVKPNVAPKTPPWECGSCGGEGLINIGTEIIVCPCGGSGDLLPAAIEPELMGVG